MIAVDRGPSPPELDGEDSLAGRELAAAHRLLIRTHLEKDLKSLRVVRELAGDGAYTKETAR